MSALPLLLSIVGFALMGLATDAHYRRRFCRAPHRGVCRAMRNVGRVALVAASVPAIAAQGWVFGPILWTGALMGGAAAVFLALNLLPAAIAARSLPTPVEGMIDA